MSEALPAWLPAPRTIGGFYVLRSLGSGAVVKDGKTADSCSGSSAAGALDLATRGDWKGT